MEYCIGVDLGGSNIAAGIVDLEAKSIVRKFKIRTNAPRPCEEIAKDIIKLCHDLCSAERIELSDIKWIGVAAPGIVKDGVVVSASNLGWQNARLAKALKSYAEIPSFVANDANCVAYAEAIWGAGAGEASVVAVTLGTGVGGGIVINGKIWEGTNGFAAEIGHMKIAVDGRRCNCGGFGCLEAYCSAKALTSDSRKIMKSYKNSLMWRLCGGEIMRVGGTTPFRAAEEGDIAAKNVISDYVRHLSIGISNIINFLQPDVVCIGGGVSGEGDKLLLPLLGQLDKAAFGMANSRTKVCVAKYKNDAGIIGSALLGKQEDHSK